MKCDKLKSLKNIECAFNTTTNQEQVIAEDSEGNCYGIDSWEEVYLKDEVDAAIAELKQNLEDAKATAYAESVDAGMRERRLKRALWLARAEMAKWKSLYYWYAISDKYKSRKFDEVERKCRAKAEEFK